MKLADIKNYSNRKLIVISVGASLAYNLLWLSIFFILITSYEQQMIVIALSFLFSYLFIAQPIKDSLFTMFYSHFVFLTAKKDNRIEEKVHSVHNIDDINRFLTGLVKLWRLPRLRFVLYHPNEKILFISSSGHGKWIRFRQPENAKFLDYLEKHHSAIYHKDLPADLKGYMANRNIKTIIPLIFRDMLLGFLGFPVNLNTVQLQMAEYIAKRIALVIENDLLKQEMPRTELMKKEFSLARKVESFLMTKDKILGASYNISLAEEGWQKKHFPALFEANQTRLPEGFFEGILKLNFIRSQPENKDKEKPLVFLLCRLSQSAHRASSLQLFSIQGYFLAISRESESLKEMVQSLHSVMTVEAPDIQLDGFIAYGSDRNHWQFCYFGKDLSMKVNGAAIKLSETASLGSTNFSWKPAYHFDKPDNITLLIRGYHLITVESNS